MVDTPVNDRVGEDLIRMVFFKGKKYGKGSFVAERVRGLFCG